MNINNTTFSLWPELTEEVASAKAKLTVTEANEVEFLCSAAIGDDDRVQELMDGGVNIQAFVCYDLAHKIMRALFVECYPGSSALHLAAARGHDRIVEKLLNKATADGT